MTRRESRKNAFLLAFQQQANPLPLDEAVEAAGDCTTPPDGFCRDLFALTVRRAAEIDAAIEPHLKRWTMARLPRVSLAILRISCAQLMFMPDIPQSVVINEAVELAKEYGGESEYSFVNGALRSICGSLGPGQ